MMGQLTEGARTLSRGGFTLLELSIVIVIVGLLIGGMLVGRSLIQTAGINAQIQQIQQYDSGISSFKSKYKQLPGDCNICGNGYGNNNGFYDEISSRGNIDSAPFSLGGENGAFFYDLQNMVGVKEKDRTIPASATFNNSCRRWWDKLAPTPVAKIARRGFHATGNKRGDIFYLFVPDNTCFCGADGTAYGSCGYLDRGTLSTLQAQALDNKLDDGIPATGDFIAVRNAMLSKTNFYPYALSTNAVHPECITPGWGYNLETDSDVACRVVIKSDYR